MHNITSRDLTPNALTTMAFSQADQNKNGKIDKEEESIFTKALKELGDKNGNGEISTDEAKEYYNSLGDTQTGDEIAAEKRLKELEQQYDLKTLKNVPKDVVNEAISLYEKMNGLGGYKGLTNEKNLREKIESCDNYLNEVIIQKGIEPNLNGNDSFYIDFMKLSNKYHKK